MHTPDGLLDIHERCHRNLADLLVVLRTQLHLYHHQGQVLAMCRLLGLPRSGLDFPLT